MRGGAARPLPVLRGAVPRVPPPSVLGAVAWVGNWVDSGESTASSESWKHAFRLSRLHLAAGISRASWLLSWLVQASLDSRESEVRVTFLWNAGPCGHVPLISQAEKPRFRIHRHPPVSNQLALRPRSCGPFKKLEESGREITHLFVRHLTLT